MLRTDARDSAIRQGLARVRTCTREELNERLPSYAWNQMFSAVDRLNRKGTVTLQHPDSSDYILSLTPRQFAEARHVTLR